MSFDVASGEGVEEKDVLVVEGEGDFSLRRAEADEVEAREDFGREDFLWYRADRGMNVDHDFRRVAVRTMMEKIRRTKRNSTSPRAPRRGRMLQLEKD